MKKKTAKKNSPPKTEKSSAVGFFLDTNPKEDSVEMMAEEATFLVVGLLKGAAPHLDEEEAFEFLCPKLLEGMSYEQAKEYGALVARTTREYRKNLQ